ncbi:MAG: hypothetical protein H8E15_12440 [Planctomycetes bacterium]|nr:hypothetical protein [Planctomycetota bacterium]
MALLLITLLLGSPAFELPYSNGRAALHVPHDDVHAIATADLPGGIRETLITTQLACRVLRTRDNGLSWQTVSGAGLELARADLVVWDHHPNGGRFIIGTSLGFWSYDPSSGQTVQINDGLSSGDFRFPSSLETPAVGARGPVLMTTKKGDLFQFDRSTQAWELLLSTGNSDDRGQVAIYPSFDENAAVGHERSVAVGIAGVLYLSQDGGANWSIQSQFATVAQTPSDPVITAISYAEDFATSGNLVLATAIENLANFTGDEGFLWQSSDHGGNFSLVHQATSSYRALKSTPQGPSGQRWFLAAVLEHPNFQNLATSVGIFRSSDGGVSWSDYGTAQDFIHETDAADTVSLNRAEIIDFEISPTYVSDGEILFGRSEGLFRSSDEGLHWIRLAFRPTTHIRGLDSFMDSQGFLWAVAGTYGSGTIIQNVSQTSQIVLDDGPMVYQDEVFVSPKFDVDGTIMVGGAQGLNLWHDPVLHAPNPHNVWGWYTKSTSSELGYARYIAFSPHFDARGIPGSDQTFFFSTSTKQKTNFRTTDGGLSGEPLNRLVDGSPAPWLRNLLVAPTYDASTSAGRTDVYGSYDVGLFRLEDRRWRSILELPADIECMAIPPNFDRVPSTLGRAFVFVGMAKYPYFAIVEDSLGGAGVAYYPTGLEEGAVVKLICPPDFETNPVVYAATYTSGIKKLDLGTPTPVWENVGGTFPDYFVDAISLSPDFPNDHTILVGTQAGLVVGKDVAGGVWELRQGRYSRDNEAPAFHYYSPNHPANPQPDRPWRWASVSTHSLRKATNLTLRDATVAQATRDGAYVEFTDYAQSIQVNSFRGPEAGTIVITAENAETGAAVYSRTVDLNTPTWANQTIQFTFPYQPVKVRVTALLDPGESLYFDGATFIPY